MTARRVVLDCDTGTDDAVAIMLAALHPDLDLVAVTTVHGNAEVAVTTENTLRVLEHVGRADVPVFPGAAGPVVPRLPGVPEPREEADRGGTAYLGLPEATTAPQQRSAAEWLLEELRATTQPLTLVATGPLTNLATVLAVDPRLTEAVQELVVLGGAHAVGNVTPSADRNLWSDAVAADRVLRAGFRRLVLVTLDATCGAALTGADAQRLRDLGTPAGTAAADFLEERIASAAAQPSMRVRGAAPLHDPFAVAALLEVCLLDLREVHVAVETTGRLTYGRSVIDVDGVGGEPVNAHVALRADGPRFLDLLCATLATAHPDSP